MQVVGGFPVAGDAAQRFGVQRVVEGAPVIAHHFLLQFMLVVFQVEREQAAAIEGVFPQHAVAPTVDGGNRGFVHPLGGQLQAASAGGPGGLGVLAAQRQKKRVFTLITKYGSRLHQPMTNTFAQFLGGGVGERDHQNFRRGERAHEGGVVLAVLPAQHQAHVKQRDGEGFPRARAGFDQTAAVKRQRQRVQRGGLAHSSSPNITAGGKQSALGG